MCRSTGLRPASSVRYRTSWKKAKELVAVFFMETTGDMAFSGSMGGAVCPTVQLCAGGVSPGAVLDSCMAGIAAGFQHSGICPAKAVRIYVTPPEKGRFCMGGVLV